MQNTTTSVWGRFSQWISRLFHKKATFDPQEKDGVWYQPMGNGVMRLGISSSATDDIGSISFMDFSTDESDLEAGDDLIELEGEKAVETLKSPVAGKVTTRNQDLVDHPELVSEQRPQDNWLVELTTH